MASGAQRPGTAYDLVIVGGTGAGYSAAIQASRLNLSVALLEESGHIGGIAIEGAGGADLDSQPNFQNSRTIGPNVLELYQRVSVAYGRREEFDEAWANHTKLRALWRYESHVGEKVIRDWLKEENVDVFVNTALKGAGNGEGVIKDGTNITAIITEDERRFTARYFIDATYEGDLYAAAGVSYVIGRESKTDFGEPFAGVQLDTSYSQLTVPVSPYIDPEDQESGLIPTVQNDPLGNAGEGDKGVGAFSWRLCLTNNTDNRVPFTKPGNYDPSQYLIYKRYVDAGGEIFVPTVVAPNSKSDLIGSTPLGLGFDMPGRTESYPEGDHLTRRKLLKELADWQKGQLYFLANDPSMPEGVRANWSQWGYARDEFVDNDNFPRRMYVRGGRRMQRSDVVITTHYHDYEAPEIPVDDPILLNLWPLDVHSVRRVVKDGSIYDEGFLWNEGPAWKPFLLPFKAIIPHASECSNLFTPTSPSSTHMGFGLLRLEHTFMTIGQVSAFAVAVAIRDGVAAAEDIPYRELRKYLDEAGFILDLQADGIPQRVESPVR